MGRPPVAEIPGHDDHMTLSFACREVQLADSPVKRHRKEALL
jgi:hypothetical protein